MDKALNEKSAELFSRATKVLPGGVSRNTLLRGVHPIYVDHGKGCHVIDVDGVQRIDFANNMASLIHGHAHPVITEAINTQLSKGTAFTMATKAEVRFAEHLCGRARGFDKIRFVNSGTEAVMAGLKAARAYTGRSKIAKVEGAYHGAYDYAEVSQGANPDNWGQRNRPNSSPLAQGTPEGVLEDVIIIPFNDPETAVTILNQHKSEIACVLIDPLPHRVGMIEVSSDFVRQIHNWTTTNGALLMFDEVITFRTEVGGTQAHFGVNPDLTSMGKMIGGGFPVGALAGRDDVMSVFVKGEKGLRLPHSGTFSANPVTMTAGRIAMELFDEDAVARLNDLGDKARAGIADAIKMAGAPACVTGAGSLFRIHMKSTPPTNYREAYPDATEQMALSAFVDALYDAGIMPIHTGSGALSTAMSIAEIDRLSDAALTAFRSIENVWADPA